MAKINKRKADETSEEPNTNNKDVSFAHKNRWAPLTWEEPDFADLNEETINIVGRIAIQAMMMRRSTMRSARW